MSETSKVPLTAAIPTYGRDQVLLDTLRYLVDMDPTPAEILVLDQTPAHAPEVAAKLQDWDAAGRIRWLRLPEPSIPKAMNWGLLEARHSVVLFLDDDIRPEPGLIAAHLAAHRDYSAALVAGRVIQPWQEGMDFAKDSGFHFASPHAVWIDQFMGGNFSLRRETGLELGGFDENFVRVAYRFEAEFAHRLRKAGHRIFFEPAACVHHLKVAAGGTRSFGQHLTTFKPNHAVGAYYYTLRTWRGWHSLSSFLSIPLRAVATRHHVRKPWWIPVTLLAHLLGMGWAIGLTLRGPRCLKASGPASRP